MRILLRQVLSADGYHIEETDNGPSALKMFSRLNPDIVLLDCRSPVPKVWPLGPGLSATAGLAATSSAWRVLDERSVGGKLLLEPLAGTLATPADLKQLFFPRVDADQPSRVQPLSATAALLQLLPAVGGIATGLDHAKAHTETLARLCTQVPCASLSLGRDVYGNPAALQNLLLPLLG